MSPYSVQTMMGWPTYHGDVQLSSSQFGLTSMDHSTWDLPVFRGRKMISISREMYEIGWKKYSHQYVLLHCIFK